MLARYSEDSSVAAVNQMLTPLSKTPATSEANATANVLTHSLFISSNVDVLLPPSPGIPHPHTDTHAGKTPVTMK